MVLCVFVFVFDVCGDVVGDDVGVVFCCECLC